jgi:hypothetical protein
VLTHLKKLGIIVEAKRKTRKKAAKRNFRLDGDNKEVIENCLYRI